ncbi:MAG: hypothetical protein EPN14_01100 [Gallionella sp.]|nr:MAG: hypothetical protein EPN14_01100 [Gallionella sp.]
MLLFCWNIKDVKRYIVGRLPAVCIGLCIALSSLAAEPVPVASPHSNWVPLAQDGLHDPSNPRLDLLQNPAEALSLLPPDLEGNERSSVVGNRVKWVKALREGYINPRTNIYPETKIKVLDLDVMLTKRDTGELPRVLFPHKQHTEWLDCSNCHEWLFKSKTGATPISMFAILDGEYCGRCHGAVAFPLTQCQRCHSVPFAAQAPAKAQ